MNQASKSSDPMVRHLSRMSHTWRTGSSGTPCPAYACGQPSYKLTCTASHRGLDGVPCPVVRLRCAAGHVTLVVAHDGACGSDACDD